VLRKVLTPLSPVEAMELLLDKMGRRRATPTSWRRCRRWDSSFPIHNCQFSFGGRRCEGDSGLRPSFFAAGVSGLGIATRETDESTGWLDPFRDGCHGYGQLHARRPRAIRSGLDSAVSPVQDCGNLYYVGSKGLANYLITTPQGHILINSDLEENVPLIRASVEKLGFKFTDIKVLLISHAHWTTTRRATRSRG
jgi:hypothetical protein